MQNACMPSITIRDVPSDARDELAARAAASGQSLQQYLRTELIDLAHRPDNAQIMAEIRERKNASRSSLGCRPHQLTRTPASAVCVSTYRWRPRLR